MDVHAETTRLNRPLSLFFALEGLSVALFLVLVGLGMAPAAFAVLLVPLQLLLWLCLAYDDQAVLVFFAAIFPLALLDLVPHPYNRYLLFPGTIAILLFFSMTRFVTDRPSTDRRLAKGVAVPGLILLCGALISGLLAALRGWVWPKNIILSMLGLEALLMTYFFATVPRTVRHIRTLALTTVGASLVAVCLFPILPTPHGEGGALGGKIITTPFGGFDLNSLGAVVATCSMVLLGDMLDTRSRTGRILHGFGISLLFAALIFTKSRGAWLGFAAAMLYVFARVRSLWPTVIAAAGGSLLLMLEPLRRMLLVRVGETSARDPSLLGRLMLWYYSWVAAKANWLFGVGFENFRMVKFKYGCPDVGNPVLPLNSHNLFIGFAVELGIVGLASFLWLLVGTILRTDRLASDRKREGWGLALGLNAAIIAFAVHGFLDFLTGMFTLFGMWIGLAAAMYRIRTLDRVRPPHEDAVS